MSGYRRITGLQDLERPQEILHTQYIAIKENNKQFTDLEITIYQDYGGRIPVVRAALGAVRRYNGKVVARGRSDVGMVSGGRGYGPEMQVAAWKTLYPMIRKYIDSEGLTLCDEWNKYLLDHEAEEREKAERAERGTYDATTITIIGQPWKLKWVEKFMKKMGVVVIDRYTVIPGGRAWRWDSNYLMYRSRYIGQKPNSHS